MISAKSLQTLVRLLSLKPLKINGSRLTAGGVKKDHLTGERAALLN